VKGVDLLVRADALPASGAGHVMRTLVLAEAWADSGVGQVGLVGTVDIEFVRGRMAELGIVPEARLPTDGRAAVLVVDSYDEVVRLEGGAWQAGTLRVLVDDLGGGVPAGFEVVWNPNPGGGEFLYPGFPGTVLSGAAHVPVRAGLPQWNGGEPRRVAVLLGGGQVGQMLASAMAQLAEEVPGISFSGAGDWVPPSWERLEPGHLWHGVMRASTLITAAGTSLLEAASARIPVVVLCTADNQVAQSAWARQAGVPVIDVRQAAVAREVATGLGKTLPLARPLPPIDNGAPAVARRLLELVSERGAPA
jgi:spore coat polysaccharide biosynthesis predicted glycosyltransferase SpsG